MNDANRPSGGSEPADAGVLSEEQARRNFLRKAGRFAVVTPPAITLLLGTSLGSQAIAGSAGVKLGGKPRPGRGRGHKPKPTPPRRGKPIKFR